LLHLPQKQRAPDGETGRPALSCLGATTSTGYFTGFSDTIGAFFALLCARTHHRRVRDMHDL
jgi:hypothetical protein